MVRNGSHKFLHVLVKKKIMKYSSRTPTSSGITSARSVCILVREILFKSLVEEPDFLIKVK